MSRAGSAEESGIVQRHGQGCVSNPHEGSKILTFLFRTPTGVQLPPTSPKLVEGEILRS
jgi:hypothetical protein